MMELCIQECVQHILSCDSLANALLANHLIFSTCSNLLQIGSEDEHAQST